MDDETITGLSPSGKVIIDSYAGEAMDPRFRKAYRDWNHGALLIQDAEYALRAAGVVISETYISEDDHWDWRALTDEESAWSEAAYDRAREAGTIDD